MPDLYERALVKVDNLIAHYGHMKSGLFSDEKEMAYLLRALLVERQTIEGTRNRADSVGVTNDALSDFAGGEND